MENKVLCITVYHLQIQYHIELEPNGYDSIMIQFESKNKGSIFLNLIFSVLNFEKKIFSALISICSFKFKCNPQNFKLKYCQIS